MTTGETNTTIDDVLEAIAKKHLGITLDPCGVDNQDIHDLAVSNWRDALHAAFMIGAEVGATLTYKTAR